jgi:hypothetical protein
MAKINIATLITNITVIKVSLEAALTFVSEETKLWHSSGAEGH